MTATPLPADIARCQGDGSACCADCKRRLQIDIDDSARWYPHMMPLAFRGFCAFQIPRLPRYENQTP